MFNLQRSKKIQRRIEKSRYIDRIVHRFVVDNFLKPYFEKRFIRTTYACIKNRSMHKATLEVQKTMKHCKIIWNNYYILKMDIQYVKHKLKKKLKELNYHSNKKEYWKKAYFCCASCIGIKK